MLAYTKGLKRTVKKLLLVLALWLLYNLSYYCSAINRDLRRWTWEGGLGTHWNVRRAAEQLPWLSVLGLNARRGGGGEGSGDLGRLNVFFSQTSLDSCSDLSHFPGSRGWKKDTHTYIHLHVQKYVCLRFHSVSASFTERSSTCQAQLQILLRAVWWCVMIPGLAI